MPSWKKVIVSGSDAALNSLNVTTSLTASGIIYPTTDGTSGQVVITDGAGNLSFSNVENTTIIIKNVSGTTIQKGTPCYITGSGTAGNIAGVWPADASNPLRMPAGVIAGETLISEAEGIGLINGFISGVNTSAFNPGDTIYVAAGGGYTKVKPTGSAILIQKLGNVEKSSVSNGSGVINGPNYYNEVPNIQQGFTWVGNSNGVAIPVSTSSLLVTSASFANNASSSLFAVSSSRSVSASQAISSSFAINASSSLFAVSSSRAVSSSFATLAATATSASYATIASSSLFATNASSSLRAISSSFATLAATATNATTATTANSTVAAATFNNAGSGDASGTTFNGGTARTISYNTVGAPSTSGTNATGTWGISITGNALTATSASFATNASSSLFAVSSSRAVSSSFATVAQSVLGTITNANTASNITPAITNAANDRILTANGGGTINGESNLTFDGTLLTLNGDFRQGGVTFAIGGNSHAEGEFTFAGGPGSHAEGYLTSASGQNSHAEGETTRATGDYSHAEGYSTIAIGNYSHAEGNATTSSGLYSHAEGHITIALGDYSHAEGINTYAGEYSHAEGDTTFAIGLASHAEGGGTYAIGPYSHAEGSDTYAAGISSHAAGLATSASGDYQSVIGMHNQPSPNPSAFIIGNGIGPVNRSNLLYASGSNVQITGSLYVSRSDNDQLSAIFATRGSKTNPAYTFIGDEDTGMYRDSANTVGLTAGSQIRLLASDTQLYLNPGTTAFQENILTISNDTIPLVSKTPRGDVSVGLSISSSYIEVTDTTSGTGPYYLMFADGTTGYRATRVDSSTLTFNATTNTLTVANLTGTASSATSASFAINASSSLFAVSSSRAVSASFATLAASATSATSATTATNANNIAVTDTTTTNATHYVTFTTGTSGNQTLRTDSSTLTFNPNTNVFTVPTVNSTTAVQGGNGSATTPAFSFSGDTNTGMYNVGADTLGFATAGGERIRIDSSGNCGIGGSPATRLDVQTSGTTQTSILGRGSDGNFRLTTRQDVSTNTDGSIIGELGIDYTTTRNSAIRFHRGASTTGGFMSFTTNDGTERVRINSTGNVGIGTTNPVDKLDVNGAIRFRVNTPSFTAAPDNGVLDFVPTSIFPTDPQIRLVAVGTSTVGASIAFQTGLNSGSISEAMRITSGGFVGVGMTNPTYKLQVNDAIASVTAFGNFTALQSIGGTGYRWTLANDSTFRLQYTTNGFSSVTTPLFVTSNGALGLNVTPTNTAGRFEASNDIVAYSTSDKRWKNNIIKIDSPLEKISQISGVEFDWIEDEPLHGNKGHDVGVIAQEVELVIPEAVQTRESGMKAVQYDKIIPLLIESIKEQQKQIDELKELVNKLTK